MVKISTIDIEEMTQALLLDFYNKTGNDSLRTLYNANIEGLRLRADVDLTNKDVVDEYNTLLATAKTTQDFTNVANYYATNKDILEPLIIDATYINHLVTTIVALKDFALSGLIKYVRNTGISYSGEWDNSIDYTVNNYVMKDGVMYCAVNDSTGISPLELNNAAWKKVFDFSSALEASVVDFTAAFNAAMNEKAEANHIHLLSEVGANGAADRDHRHDSLYAPMSHSDNNAVHVTESQKSLWNSKANGTHSHGADQLTGVASAVHYHNYAPPSHTHSPSFNVSEGVMMTSTDSIRISSPRVYLSSVLLPTLPSAWSIGEQGYEWGEVNAAIGRFSNVCFAENLKYVNLTQISDRNAKKDISPISMDQSYSFINNIDVVSYKYKEDESQDERVGVIAQQLIEADSDFSKYIVSEAEEQLTIKPVDLIFPLIQAVQKLSLQVEELQERVNKLEKQ